MPDLLTVVAEMQAKPGKEEDLRQVLLALVEATHQEDGCVQYDLHAHTSSVGRFVFYENWKSKEHLDRHASSPHMQTFAKVAVDLLAGPARVETYRRIA